AAIPHPLAGTLEDGDVAADLTQRHRHRAARQRAADDPDPQSSSGSLSHRLPRSRAVWGFTAEADVLVFGVVAHRDEELAEVLLGSGRLEGGDGGIRVLGLPRVEDLVDVAVDDLVARGQLPAVRLEGLQHRRHRRLVLAHHSVAELDLRDHVNRHGTSSSLVPIDQLSPLLRPSAIWSTAIVQASKPVCQAWTKPGMTTVSPGRRVTVPSSSSSSISPATIRS